MNSNVVGKFVIKYLLIALGFAVFILGGLFLSHNYSQAEQLSINLITVLSSFMLCIGIVLCFIAFKFIK